MRKIKEAKKELPVMTEEEREERIRQEYKYQQDLLELCKTFLLMGYERSDIFEALKSLKYEVAETQVDFYCEYITDRPQETIQEINANLWKFLWEIEPPEMPEPEPKPEKQYQEEAVSSYMCRIVVLNLLVDRIDYLKSVLKAGCFKMADFISVGYDACYVQTMKTAIEENPGKHSRDIAKEVYRILYQEAKHMEGYIYSIDKRDFWSMIEVCRREWKNRRELIEKDGEK